MSKIKVIVKITPKNIGKLEEISNSGTISSGYYQDFQFAIDVAIKEFIKKYDKE